jgi:hypothetical protein
LLNSTAYANISYSNHPIRIPRVFFENPIVGSLHAQLNAVNPRTRTFQASGPLAWTEYSTTLPVPKPGAIADYRDFKGCLQYNDYKELSVCFNVMPDVSSVGINQQEMTINGMDTLISDQLLDRCPFSVKTLTLTQVVHTQNGYIVQYTGSGEILSAQGCEPRNQNFQIKIELNQT